MVNYITAYTLFNKLSHPDSSVKLSAINRAVRLSTNQPLYYFPHVLRALAKAIYDDTAPRVRLAAINAIGQLYTNLEPHLWLRYYPRVLPTLAEAIYDDDLHVRLAAINVTGQLFTNLDTNLELQHHRLVLQALDTAMKFDLDPRVRSAATASYIICMPEV